MAELGLGYDVARELNPGLIMASTCLMGQTGPAAKLAGYGYHAASVCGFYEVTGWDDRPPGGPFNAYTDTIAPRFLATLIAALDHRRRTGEGQYIDHSQMESALHFLGPELLEAQVTGRTPAGPATSHPALRRTTPIRVSARTSGARSRSRPTRSGGAAPVLGDPAWAAGPRSTRRPAAARTRFDRSPSWPRSPPATRRAR